MTVDQRSGDCQPCFCSSVIENNGKHGLTNKEAAWLAAALMSVSKTKILCPCCSNKAIATQGCWG